MFTRKINVFEKMLLPVGIGLTFFGFYLILLAEKVNTDLAWLRLVAVFLWMMLLFVVIMTATTEDMKEELAGIQAEHITEVKMVREITHELLQEIKLMRQEQKIKR